MQLYSKILYRPKFFENIHFIEEAVIKYLLQSHIFNYLYVWLKKFYLWIKKYQFIVGIGYFKNKLIKQIDKNTIKECQNIHSLKITYLICLFVPLVVKFSTTFLTTNKIQNSKLH